MGPGRLSAGRAAARPRPLHRVRALAALTAASIALAGPVAAADPPATKTDWFDPASYGSDAMASRATIKEPNMRLQNFFGATFERRMLFRGAGAAAAAGAAIAATRAAPVNWSNYAKLTASTLSGAALGFATGCATGAAVGAVGAVFSAGLTAGVGCVGWGGYGALVGAFAGQSVICIDESCKVKAATGEAAKTQGLSGDAIKSSTTGAAVDTIAVKETGCQRYYSFVGCTFNNDLQDVYAKIGMNRTFPCRTDGVINECAFVPALDNGKTDYNNVATYQFLGGGDEVAPNRMQVLVPQMVGVGDGDPRCAGYHCWRMGSPFPYVSSYAAPRSVVTLIVSTQSFPDEKSVPQETIRVAPTRPAWADLLSNKIDAQTAELKLSNEFLAAMANQTLKDEGDDSVDSDPITPAQVQATKDAYPDLAPKISDLVRPYDLPNREAQGAAGTKPAQAATPVSIVNGGSGGDTVQRTKEEADQELDNSDGLLGDIMAPAKAFLKNSLGGWMTPDVQLPPAQCPVPSIDLPTLLGRQDLSHPTDPTIICDWLEGKRPLFIPFLHVVFIVLAARRIMKA